MKLGMLRRLIVCVAVITPAVVLGPPPAQADEPRPDRVEFNRDIRPILAESCYPCHGPDKARRKADLRLDTEEGALADLGGYKAIVPGDLEASELYRRITSDDDEERMPPAKAARKLNAHQVQLIRAWIIQGARWQKHWALLPPQRPPVPEVTRPGGMKNAIDAFVRARLDREGLAPAPEAERPTLIRRLSLDLTGLPPTPAEVDAFVADPSPCAYETLVDRLLASPRFGERMAVRWLAAARYADTNGYQSDGERFMWRWRDWVIDAFNSNMPFDQFTIEQLAGDLLPRPTLEQRIATGFNRNHRGNAEGGIIPEEYAVEYVVDRVETTSTVWLGLTLGCARCHDHKFDPVTQREFYQLFAFFNNVPEKGRAVKFGNSPPLIKAPTAEQQRQRDQLAHQLACAEAHWDGLQADLAAAQSAWEHAAGRAEPGSWTITRGRVVHLALDEEPAGASGTAAPAFRGGAPAFTAGQIHQAAELDGSRYLEAGDVAAFGFYDRFTLTAWIKAADERGGTILSRATDAAHGDGYYLALEQGKLQLNLVKRWLDDALRVETQRTLEPGRWHHVLATYDGSRVAAGVRLYVDGKPEALNVLLDELNQSFLTKEPLRVGAGAGRENRFRGAIDEVAVYDRVLTAEEAAIAATPASIAQIVATSEADRTTGQAQKVGAYFLERAAPEPLRRAWTDLVALRERRAALEESLPTTMVMEELPAPRATFVLQRGAYDKPGEQVTAGVPACLPPLPTGSRPDRLALARWLVDRANPLTARVAANRYWEMLFGAGLVRTVDDFGAQGEWPTHPELLDWLATEYMATGWNTKALLKTIVMSATYRQSSRATPDLVQKDPDNRLLARGPRFRLPPEMVRDQALAASGLLVERLGGPSVRPYQPDGLWKDLAEVSEYRQDHGPNLYRRSLYTFWKRTISPPEMVTFDAASRESCSVRTTRTNTPLQALTLLNDVTFVEAARALAQRVLRDAPASGDDRLILAFRLVLARTPDPGELAVLRAALERHRAHYRHGRQAARALVGFGESPRDPSADPAELAAYTEVASTILNLDESITKE